MQNQSNNSRNTKKEDALTGLLQISEIQQQRDCLIQQNYAESQIYQELVNIGDENQGQKWDLNVDNIGIGEYSLPNVEQCSFWENINIQENNHEIQSLHSSSQQVQQPNINDTYKLQSNKFDNAHKIDAYTLASSQQAQQQAQQQTPQQQQQQTLWPRCLLHKKRKDSQQKNTPRFLVRLFITHIYQYFSLCLYSPEQQQQVHKKCEQLAERIKNNKQDVFLVSDLRMLMEGTINNGDRCLTEHACRLNRMLYSEILRNQTLNEMNRPKSQIGKNRIRYLRAAKVYNLRCRNKQLVIRNQSQ